MHEKWFFIIRLNRAPAEKFLLCVLHITVELDFDQNSTKLSSRGFRFQYRSSKLQRCLLKARNTLRDLDKLITLTLRYFVNLWNDKRTVLIIYSVHFRTKKHPRINVFQLVLVLMGSYESF